METADASNINEQRAASIKTKSRQPVLEEGQSETEKFEMVFEEVFQVEVPSIIVGIEFKHIFDSDEGILVWESVLRELSKKLIEEGIESVRQLHDMEEYGVLVKNGMKSSSAS